jgi:hypothetical protein
MKQETTLNMLIDKMELSKVDIDSPLILPHINAIIYLLQSLLVMERHQIEQAFEDGVGEGLTDPERPFTGKEYYDIKYKK